MNPMKVKVLLWYDWILRNILMKVNFMYKITNLSKNKWWEISKEAQVPQLTPHNTTSRLKLIMSTCTIKYISAVLNKDQWRLLSVILVIDIIKVKLVKFSDFNSIWKIQKIYLKNFNYLHNTPQAISAGFLSKNVIRKSLSKAVNKIEKVLNYTFSYLILAEQSSNCNLGLFD